MVAVGKGFVTVAHGQVHYRHCGRGPLLVMLHDSARSSLQHAASMEWLGEHFTVVAPDLPGCGNSAPLPVGQRAVPDYSAALATTLAALGVERCLLYGNHYGAAIALHFAAHHPARVALVVLDGLELQVPDEGLDVPVPKPAGPVPCDDGSHLAAAWTGVLDAARHWPARSQPGTARLAVALPDDAALHESAIDLFMADQSATDAQRAAMRCDARPAFARLHVPAVVLDRHDDHRRRDLDPLPPLPATCRVVTVAPGAMAWRAQLLDVLRSAQLVGKPGSRPPRARLWLPANGSVTSSCCMAPCGCDCGTILRRSHRSCCCTTCRADRPRCATGGARPDEAGDRAGPAGPRRIASSALPEPRQLRHRAGRSTRAPWASQGGRVARGWAAASRLHWRRATRDRCVASCSTACRWCGRASGRSSRGTTARPSRPTAMAPTCCLRGNSCASRRRAGRGSTDRRTRRAVMTRIWIRATTARCCWWTC